MWYISWALTPATCSSADRRREESVLCGIFPKLAILATCFPQAHSDSSVARRLPHTITSLYHPRYKELSQAELMKECERVFSEDLT